MDVFVGDVTSDADIEHCADAVPGPVSRVVANAGIALGGHFESIPIDEWQRLYDVNVLGVVRTFAAFLPRLRQQQHGHLIAMSSSAGLFPDDPYAAPYASTKAAIVAMCRSLSLQVAQDSVDVSLSVRVM